MQNQLIITDYRIKINAENICITEVVQWAGDDLSKGRQKQDANLINNSTRGLMSAKSVKRIKKAVNWLVLSSQQKQYYSLKAKKKIKFKVNFITLTIPPQKDQEINEKTFKTLLNTWLTYHRKYNKLNNYIWKLELHKDGRIHIHVTTDTFIYLKSVRESWNTILKRNGLLEHHFEKYKNYTPPSTEVKPVDKIKKLGAYLAKYLTKNNKENPKFNGRVWGCSSKITQVLNNTTYVSPDIIGKITRPIFDNCSKMLEVFTKPNMFGRKWKVADIYLMDLKDWISIEDSYLYNLFKELVLFLRKETPRETQLQLQLM